MTLPPFRADNEVLADLKRLLQDMDLEITKEFDNEEISGFWITSGSFPLLIENQKPLKYYVVALQITFSDEAILTAINGYYDRQDQHFIFRLTQTLTTPQTSFVRVIESGRTIGFTILKSIYPFHEGFSIREFDQAIQAVTSAGDVGVAFLKSEMGPMDIDHTPPRPLSEPGPMYE